ncbi:MAG: VOC family protein [Acidobacteriota bacterium]
MVGKTECATALRGLQTAVSCTALALVFATPTTVAAKEEPNTIVRGVSYVGVTVSDLERTADDYTYAAALTEANRSELSGVAAFDAFAGQAVTAKTRLLESTNAQLRVMSFTDASGKPLVAPDSGAVAVNGTGLAHVCFQADDDRGFYPKFLERDAQPLGNPEMVTLNPRNPVQYAYAKDPDGVLFEVEHIDVSRVPPDSLKPGFHRLRHISLATPDMERTVAFYSKLLGTPSPRRAGGTEGLSGQPFDEVSGLPGTRLQMAWFQTGNLEVEIIHYLSHPPETLKAPRPLTALGYSMVVFEVDDVADVGKAVSAAGGTIVSEPESIDGGTIQFGRDPDGNLLGFFAPPEGSPLSARRFQKPE